MGPVVAWIIVATIVAVLVIGVTIAGAWSREDVRQFLADLRARGGDGSAEESAAVDEPFEVQEVSVDELFSIGERPENAYLEPRPIGHSLARITQRARSSLARRAA